MKEIIIVGAGGFGRSLLQWIKDINKVESRWKIKGFIDDNLNALEKYECDYKVLGTIQNWIPKKNEVFACAIAEPKIKEKIVLSLKSKGATFNTIIHPSVLIGEFNKIGEGVVIYPRAVITVNARIGNFVTLLTSNITHDVQIGDFATISSNCGINGHSNIGKRVFIGSNVTIIPSRLIGDNAYIGAGSVVIRDVLPNTVVAGVPARFIRNIE